MVIREYRESDIPRIARLFYNTIRTVNAKDYSPEQIEAWAPEIWPDEKWAERFQEKLWVFVAEYEDMTTGFAEFEESGHIDCFYIHHEWQRRGIGTQIIRHIVEEAQEMNLEKINVEASITALAFFKEMGFSVVREEEKEYRGVMFPIHYMEKVL